jgi:hypothetical protein
VKLGVAATVLCCALSMPVQSEEAKRDCFRIISPVAGNPQSNFILLNMCNAATWMLIKTPHSGTQPGEREYFTYRWLPLSVGDREPQMTRQLQ